jgi:hypothetical protein
MVGMPVGRVAAEGWYRVVTAEGSEVVPVGVMMEGAADLSEVAKIR